VAPALAASAERAALDATPPAGAGDLDALSEDELEARLLAKLERTR
jgi:hypothetical protein